MVIDLVRSVGSANMCFRINDGHVLQTLREQLKVPGSRLEGSELLPSEFLRFRSRLNETSGGLGKIGAVSGSDCRILKFLRTTFLAAKLLEWKVSVKGIRSSLSVSHFPEKSLSKLTIKYFVERNVGVCFISFRLHSQT